MDYDPTMADDTYTVERSVTPARIYDQIANFHNWTNWSPWETVDTELKRTYSGAESGIGAVYGWSGNRKAGQAVEGAQRHVVHHPAGGVRLPHQAPGVAVGVVTPVRRTVQQSPASGCRSRPRSRGCAPPTS
jgi:hypothetical protein